MGVAGSFLGAGATGVWLVPAIMFVLLAVAAWLGLRWVRSGHREALRSVPLFSLLPDRELLAVLSSARAVGFPSGATVIHQGEQEKGFFVITDGTAKVTLDGAELVFRIRSRLTMDEEDATLSPCRGLPQKRSRSATNRFRSYGG